MSGLLSVMALHYATNSWTSPWIDWLSWLESEPLEPVLVLIKLSSQHQELWNEMWPTDKEGCGGNNKLSTSCSSARAHKEDAFMGGDVGGWQRLIVSLYPGCWDYIFSLSFLWGYSSEEGDSPLTLPAVIPLSKSFNFLELFCFSSFPSPPIIIRVKLCFHCWFLFWWQVCISHGLIYSVKSIQKSSDSNRVGTTLFNLGN